MTQTQKALIIPALGALFILGGAVAGYAQLSRAETTDTTVGNMMQKVRGMMGDRGEGIHGTITAIDGTTITVKSADGTIYTVQVADADIDTKTDEKNGTEGTVADLKVNDEVGVRGTVDGTNVTATHVRSGALGFGRDDDERGMGRGERGGMRGGNGVMGEVTKVDGNTITVTAPNGTAYTVNAEHAKVERFVEGSLGDIHEGSRIGVHGDRNGTTMTADRIIADMPEAPEKNN